MEAQTTTQTTVETSPVVSPRTDSLSRAVALKSADVAEDVFTDDIQELYDDISAQLRRVIGKEKFGMQHLGMMMNITTQTVQRFVKVSSLSMTGPEKKSIAIRVIKHVLTDFKNSGQIPEEYYLQIMIGIDAVGPVMIDLVVEVWKKASSVISDVSENGCSGCGKRNCCVQ
tara:strand:- start:18979 stop:19491 length:513 start_codon:yes stop_codon:yes gene_type:complete